MREASSPRSSQVLQTFQKEKKQTLFLIQLLLVFFFFKSLTEANLCEGNGDISTSISIHHLNTMFDYKEHQLPLSPG